MATSLKDRMAAYVAANSRLGGQSCRTCALPKETLEIVRDLKAGKGLPGPGSNRAIAAAIRKEAGLPISEDMIARHFKLHEPQHKG